VAQAHAFAHHGLEAAAARLAGFLVEVQGRRTELLRDMTGGAEEGTLAAYFADEIRRPARDLGLDARGLALQRILAPLAAPGRSADEM